MTDHSKIFGPAVTPSVGVPFSINFEAEPQGPHIYWQLDSIVSVELATRQGVQALLGTLLLPRNPL